MARADVLKMIKNPQLVKEIPRDQVKVVGKVQPPSGQNAKLKSTGPFKPFSKPIPRPRPTGPSQCTNTACDKSDVASEDGQLLCRNCGTVVAEQHITSSINFGEASNGAAVVQGSYLGADQTHVRLRGPGGSRVVGGQDTREVAEYQGKQLIRAYCETLTLSDTIKDMAGQVYKLAIGLNFIQGREARKVAAASVYIGCRRTPENKTMLMDLADLLNVNVFKLGHVFIDLVTSIGLENAALMPINAESLILRFAERLEFGADMYRVAGDAVKIMARFDRDWMVTGRRPSGLCGAALILAARMNNYRRTIREVVYLVKVSDMTIQKRLDEFKITPSSDLTIEEFRNHGPELESQCDPPAFNKKSRSKQKRRKRNNGTAEDEQTSDSEQSYASSTIASRENSVAVSSRRAQADNEAMPPPPVPIDPALLAVSSQGPSSSTISDASPRSSDSSPIEKVGQKRKRGRPPKVALPTPPTSQIVDESRIENEISAVVSDPRNQALADVVRQEAQSAAPNSPPPTQPDSTSPVPAGRQDQVEDCHTLSDDSTSINPSDNRKEQIHRGPTSVEVAQPTRSQATIEPEDSDALSPSDAAIVSTIREDLENETVGENDFCDDPEVQDCKLTEDEIAIKERIWTHINRDYLRQQQARLVRQELEAAYGTGRVVVRRKRKRARMGDMTAYHKDGESSGYRTPADATSAMMGKRGYSSKLNYDAIKQLYEKSEKTGGHSKETSVTENTTDADISPPSQEIDTPSPPESFAGTPQPSDSNKAVPIGPIVTKPVANPGDIRDEDEEMSDNPDDYVDGPEEELDYLATQYGSEEDGDVDYFENGRNEDE